MLWSLAVFLDGCRVFALPSKVVERREVSAKCDV